MSFSQYLRLADVMARMSLRADANKFFLGYIWWVLEPFLFVAVFYVVFTMILSSRQPDFLPFLMTGKLVFMWISKAVVSASNSILNGAGLIGKVNVAKSLFPLAAVQETAYKQMAVFLLLGIVMVTMGYSVTPMWLYLVPLILVTYLLILAAGYTCSIVVCMVRDFFPLVSMAMLFLLFCSGIFFDPRALSSPEKTEMLFALNPVAFLLDAYRQVLMYATPPDMLHLFSIAVGSAATICLAVLLMRRFSQLLALKALSA